MTQQRQTKTVLIESMTVDFDSLDTVMETLQWFKERYGGTHTDLHFRMDRPDPYSENECPCLFGTRPETDDEMSARLLQEEHLLELRESQERRTYEELKKKYG